MLSSFSQWMVALWAFALVAFPYYRGLFFYEDMLFADMIIGFWSLAGFAVGGYSLWLSGDDRGVWARMGGDLLWLLGVTASLLLMLQYGMMALLGVQASHAWDQAYRMGTVLLSFIALTALLVAAGEKGRRIVFVGTAISIGWTALFPFLTIVGLTRFPDSVLGTRFSSVFQYPNTYGAMVGAVMLMTLIALSDPPQDLRAWRWRFPAAWVLVSFSVGLIFSASRGAWVLWPVAWWLVLWLVPIVVQLRMIVLTLLLFLIVAPILPVFPAWQEKSSWVVIIAPMALGAVYAGTVILIDRWTLQNRVVWELSSAVLSAKAWEKRAIIPLVSMVLGVLSWLALRLPLVSRVMPEAVALRLADISLSTQNVSERFVFFRDSLKLIREHWLFGAGGDAWRDVFLHYASYPYYSTQTHSFIFQLAIEGGIVGVLLFAAVLLSAFGLGVRAYFQGEVHERYRVVKVAAPALYLLAHGQIDFDFSFGYVLLVFFTWLSILAASGLTVQTSDWTVRTNVLEPQGMRNGTRLCASFVRSSRFGDVLFLGALAMGLIHTALTVREGYAIRLEPAGRSLDDVRQIIDYKARVRYLDREMRFMKIEFYRQACEQTRDPSYCSIALQELESVHSMSEKDPRTLMRLARIYADMGEETADRLYAQAVETAPLFLPAYEARYEWLGKRALQAVRSTVPENTIGAQGEANRAIEIVQYADKEMRKMQQRIEDERRRLDRESSGLKYPEFTETPMMLAYRGIVKLLSGDIAAGRNILENKVDQLRDTEDRLDARLLLAAAAEHMSDHDSKDRWLQDALKWQSQHEVLGQIKLEERYHLFLRWLGKLSISSTR
ncbi:O-antigen ligase family protein [Hydrogenibacillus sp. N12]|uniref:O-antigen ligase family protein n=1 Tax=Hydrogenibacillus sp. N12 TaxID=2866627 RepID=UPI001C7DEB3D|nr:O-antigen ligase family protein [Hydrogenibacillus sp. N12]QZA32868.1 O-antigen ligase family protein [Hydrogenibacillus sp. N12]